MIRIKLKLLEYLSDNYDDRLYSFSIKKLEKYFNVKYSRYSNEIIEEIEK